MNRFLKDVVIRATRAQADRCNHSCLTASLAEVAISTGTRGIISLDQLDQTMTPAQKGRIPPKRFFDHLKKGVDTLSLEVVDVIVSRPFLERLDDPAVQAIVARVADGKVVVPKPHIRIMAHNDDVRDFTGFHSEVDNGDIRTSWRIQRIESKGWFTVGVIVLRPKHRQGNK